MKKRFLTAIFASLALITAACGAEEEAKDVSKTQAASETETEESTTEKETTEKEEVAKEDTEKEKAEAEKAAAAAAVNNARNYLDHVPYFTEEVVELDKVSYNFINSNPDLFPAMTEDAIKRVKELADDKITSKHLNKNVTPYLEKVVNFAGDVIQIEEGTLDDGTPYSLILIEDMDFNAIYAIGYHATDILEGDFVEIWGLPLGEYQYSNTDGGVTLAQALATSYIE